MSATGCFSASAVLEILPKYRLLVRQCFLGLFALLALHSIALAGTRYERWQSTRPLTLTAWMTHDYSSTPHEVNVPYFEGSGLNTAWDGVRSGSISWDNVDVTFTPAPPNWTVFTPETAVPEPPALISLGVLLASLGGKLHSSCKHNLYPSITFPTTPKGEEP